VLRTSRLSVKTVQYPLDLFKPDVIGPTDYFCDFFLDLWS